MDFLVIFPTEVVIGRVGIITDRRSLAGMRIRQTVCKSPVVTAHNPKLFVQGWHVGDDHLVTVRNKPLATTLRVVLLALERTTWARPLPKRLVEPLGPKAPKLLINNRLDF